LIWCLPILLMAACQDQSTEPDLDSRKNLLFQQSSFRQPVAGSIKLLANSPQGVSLLVKPGSLNIGTKLDHKQLFSTLDCDSCGWTNELGKPRLPVIRRFVEVPAGSEVSAQFKASDRQTIKLADLGAQHVILPVQRSIEKLPGAAERTPFEMNTELYSQDAFYPDQDVSISKPFVIRGHWLVMVEAYPLQYNPARAEIQHISDATLELTFSGKASGPANQKRFSATFAAWFKANVINYQPPAKMRDISTDKYADGFLYVVGNNYASNNDLLNYIEIRRAEGHYVEMVPMSDIGTTDTQLRAYIRTQYLNWSEPTLSYVVLVGDVADVPTHDGTANSNNQATDLYYASIDPDNYTADLLYPDLFVSRISVNNVTELTTYLTRAGTYLYADYQTDTSWMNKLSWIASCDNDDITEGTHNYVINTYTSAFGYTGTHPNNPQPGGDLLYCGDGDATQPIIQTTIGDGRLMINFSGHGGETYWADPTFEESYLDGVLPPDAAPFVISNACVTGSYAYSSDCWGEIWLAHSAGAIIFWGSSNNSYWDEDDILEKRLWDGVFFDGITRFADITRNAKLETLAHYGANDTMEYYFEMYNNLGDATIDFYTGIPFVPNAVYPTELPVGIGSISFTVTNSGPAVEGALVCVRGGVVQQVGYTDASGQVELILDPPPADVGNLEVTITAHNLKRHEGTVLIIPADGSYLVHDSHEVTSDGSTPIVPNPGRHVVMPITVQNIGTEAATGITATLSSDSPSVTITQDTPVYGAIDPDQTGRSTTHAEFDISATATDAEVLNFSLDWTTDGGYNGSTRFNVTVQRPILVYVSHTVDDSAGECDQDGFADENELTLFDVTIENQGSGDASNVAVALSAADCNSDSPVSYGDIPAGQKVAASFTVTPQPGIACPALNLLFNLSASADELPAPDLSSFTELLNADVVSGSYSDDMESIEPNGWSHGSVTGNDDWGYVTTSAHSPTHSWFAADVDDVTDIYLDTPPITIGDTAQLSFWHRFETESGYDGGVLEISTNDGGSYSDLGSFISQGGYNDTIWEWSSSSPIAGQEAWTGTGAWSEVIVDLSSFGPADVIIRFRMTADSSIGDIGWWIDDLQLDAETVVCQQQECLIVNRPPVADAGVDQQVDEGIEVTLIGSASYDPDDDTIDFSWNQTAGPNVTLSDPQVDNPTFTAPLVEGYVDLVFELTVSDAEYDDSDSVTVTIWGTCDDGNACTDDTLNGNSCDHTPTDCNDENSCTADSCDVATGCVNDGPAENGNACDDGDACTQTDACLDGDCLGSDPVVCTALDSCHLVGVCDSQTGVCSDPLADDGSACDDADGCTQTDSCQSGVCVGADPVVCTALDACHDAGVCNSETGVCTDPAVEDGTACDDLDACTQTDTCQTGTCTGGDAVVCSASDTCHVAGVCDPQTGSCTDPIETDGTACDDSDACTQTDSCLSGVCTGSNPVVCTALDVCHQAGVCDSETGVCTDPPVTDGSACDDQSVCTATDTCQAGVCVGGDPVADGTACDAESACTTTATCQVGVCVGGGDPLADGTACNDGDACTTSDTCQTGVCVGADPVVCTASDACHAAGVCNPETGVCTDPPVTNGTACDDQSVCTATDTCQAGVCVGGDPVTDGTACDAESACTTNATCQTGVCVGGDALPDGTACDDSDACTQTDTCQAAVCVGANPVTCTAQDACHQAGVCDPANGTCSNPASPDGTSCDDSDACTQSDSCISGVCQGSDPVVCTASDECHQAGVCDPVNGTCSNPESPDGTACTDGACLEGVCITEDSASGCGCSHTQTPLTQNILLFGLLFGLSLAAVRRRKSS